MTLLTDDVIYPDPEKAKEYWDKRTAEFVELQERLAKELKESPKGKKAERADI